MKMSLWTEGIFPNDFLPEIKVTTIKGVFLWSRKELSKWKQIEINGRKFYLAKGTIINSLKVYNEKNSS